MNVAIFGGTFDPVHRGHLAVARAAAERYDLGRIYFVPADIPPHKRKQPITPYYHRYAMLALATAGEKRFVPSLMEASQFLGKSVSAEHGVSYSIDTVRRFRVEAGKQDRLLFIIGIDAFAEIATWREPEALLREAEFIVASRPGFSLGQVAEALPEGLRPKREVTRLYKKEQASGDIVLGPVTIHLLPETHERVSATQIRQAAAHGRSLGKMVPEAVAEYIRKMHLYRRQETGDR